MLTELTARVAAQPFFAGLPPDAIRELCVHATPVSYPQGSRLFSEGEQAERFWLLESGAVALYLHVPGHGDRVVETIGAGELLGWSWLYPPYRWQFGATARAPVSAVAFTAAPVRALCDTDAELGYALLHRFGAVVVDRLQTARLRLLDLWGEPSREVVP